MATHRYETSLRWSGSTGLGWERYDRTHTAVAPPAEQEVRLTTGESKGDPRILNPEQLVVMAASSCQLLMFLHLGPQQPPRVGQMQAPAGPDEQGHAELGLEVGDLLGDARAGEAQHVRRGREGAVLGRGEEVRQLLQGHGCP